MKIYLAGKIGKDDWRHLVVPNLQGAWNHFSADPAPEWPVVSTVDGHHYVGPYLACCGHECGYGEGEHGVAAGNNRGCFPNAPSRTDLQQRCLTALDKSDLVYAWLDSSEETFFGTLAELGYAKALGKHIVIAHPEQQAEPTPEESPDDDIYDDIYDDGDEDEDEDLYIALPSETAFQRNQWFALTLADRVIECPHPQLGYELAMQEHGTTHARA